MPSRKTSPLNSPVTEGDYNLRLPTEAWQQRGLRLRVVVHAGEVHYDGRGYLGEALDVAFRLLDAPEFKAFLQKVAAPLIVAVSEEIYVSVVMHQYDGINSHEYHPAIRVHVTGRRRRGYVHSAGAFESLTVDSATGAIVPPATPFFNQLERHLIQAARSASTASPAAITSGKLSRQVGGDGVGGVAVQAVAGVSYRRVVRGSLWPA